jgi:hypothetical protein
VTLPAVVVEYDESDEEHPWRVALDDGDGVWRGEVRCKSAAVALVEAAGYIDRLKHGTRGPNVP